MSNIFTITLNPAYDLHYTIKQFEPYKENIVSEAITEVGGKGINITRALYANGIDSLAFVLLGRENCAEYEKIVKEEGVPYLSLYVAGKIRENITIHTDNAPETRISLDNFVVSEQTFEKFESMLYDKAKSGDIVAFSGRLPKGVEKSRAVAFLTEVKRRGMRLIIDSSSFNLDDLSKIKPWLIKPNEEEIAALYKGVDTMSEITYAADSLVGAGIENVIISMGGAGAVYAGGDRGSAIIAHVPKIMPISTIGAGDSTIAGFISALNTGCSLEECMRRAVSYGTAACLRKGTRPPLPDDIARIAKSVEIFTQKLQIP